MEIFGFFWKLEILPRWYVYVPPGLKGLNSVKLISEIFNSTIEGCANADSVRMVNATIASIMGLSGCVTFYTDLFLSVFS